MLRRLETGRIHECTNKAQFAAGRRRRLLTVFLLAMLGGETVLAQQSPTQPLPEPGVEGAVRDIIFQQPSGTLAGPQAEGGARREPGARRAGESATAVQSIRSERRQVTVGGQGAFEPILHKKLPVTALPDVGDAISINATDAPTSVIEVLDTVARATGWNVVASEGIEQKQVRFWVTDVKPRQVMEVLRFNGIHYEFDPETKFLYVMLDGEFLEREYGETRYHEFTIRHADVVDMESILTGLMSQTGRLISDPRTGNILVWDTQANLDAMKEALARLDVPLEPRVFELKYLAAEDLLDTIESMLSERGIAQADPRTNSIVVTDLPSRQDQIGQVLESLDQKLITKTWTLRYASAESVMERLENLIPEEIGTITIDKDTHQVSLTSIPSRVEEVDAMIREWDQKGRQVQIEAFLVSARTSVMRDLSIDWSYFDEIGGTPFSLQSGDSRPDYTSAPASGQRANVGRLPYRAFLRDPITGSLFQELSNPGGREAGNTTGNYILDPEFKGNRVAVVLDYLDSTGKLSILARPRVTVQDGKEAVFENTTDRPFQSVGFTSFGGVVVNDNVQDNISSRVVPGSIEFVKVGTILKVKPRINDEAKILMDIETEESTAEDKVILAAGLASTVPEKTQNKAETQVLVNDGQTIVIGGLRAVTLTDDVEKVPLLGDIPFVGRLFKSTKKDHLDRELAVFLTPTIVDEFTQPEALRAASFDESMTTTMRHSEKNIWRRAQARILRNKNELTISVGHSGSIHSDGELLSLDEVQATFDELRVAKLKPKILLRAHPNAPVQVTTQIREMAMEAELKIETVQQHQPFVPAPRDETGPRTDKSADSPEPEAKTP